jgi:hypothetical protein
MSRPQTPRGMSPRGSKVNLLDGQDAAFSPSKIEKDRLRAEAEVHAALLKEQDKQGEKKKEEVAVAASPGTSNIYLGVMWVRADG